MCTAADAPIGRLRGRKLNEKVSPSESALDMLVKAASVINPKQFELPREMSVNIQFPGSDKGKNHCHNILFFNCKFSKK